MGPNPTASSSAACDMEPACGAKEDCDLLQKKIFRFSFPYGRSALSKEAVSFLVCLSQARHCRHCRFCVYCVRVCAKLATSLDSFYVIM